MCRRQTAATTDRPSLRRLVRAALGSSDGLVAADDAVADRLKHEWLADDPDHCQRCETWPIDAVDVAPRIAAACHAALARRRG